jgi:hypothetical protein
VLYKEILRAHHCLEFQIISTRILEEHCPLFSRLSYKPDMRLHNEGHTSFFHPLRESVKLLDRKNDPEMGDRNSVLVHIVVIIDRVIGGPYVMTDDLMTVEGIINPGGRRPSFFASEKSAVKVA